MFYRFTDKALGVTTEHPELPRLLEVVKEWIFDEPEYYTEETLETFGFMNAEFMSEWLDSEGGEINGLDWRMERVEG